MPIRVPEEFSTEPSLRAEYDGRGRLSRAVFERDGEKVEIGIEPSQRAAKAVSVDEMTFAKASEMQDWAEMRLRHMADRALRRPRCGFCEKTAAEVERLVAGPVSYICNECIEVCARIIAEE